MENNALYVFLDYFFLVFHSVLVFFNLSGWIWRQTRRIHLIVISLTVLSWFGLGLFYGWGYCPCTDWHWQVKRTLGETGLPSSYIKYYLDQLTGLDWNPAVVDALVLVSGIGALVLSIGINYRDRQRAKQQRRTDASGR